MKKLFVLVALSAVSYLTQAQTPACDPSACKDKPACEKPACCEKSCSAKSGSASINAMRSDLQTVIAKMSKSSVSFNDEVVSMEIADEACIVKLCKAASTVRNELVTKVDPSKLNASLKNYKPGKSSNERKMASGLKKEIELLTAQVEML